MTLRFCKLALVAAVAFFLTLVVFNNLTDYDSNYHFVEHVLSWIRLFLRTMENGGLRLPAWRIRFFTQQLSSGKLLQPFFAGGEPSVVFAIRSQQQQAGTTKSEKTADHQWQK